MQKNRKIIENISQTKSWFSKKINKIDKPLARLTKGLKKFLHQQTSFKNRDIKTDTTEIQRIITDYDEKQYTNQLDNLEILKLLEI